MRNMINIEAVIVSLAVSTVRVLCAWLGMFEALDVFVKMRIYAWDGLINSALIPKFAVLILG